MEPVWREAIAASEAFLRQHALLAGFLFLLADEAGVPTPAPGNLLIVLLGVRARQGAVRLVDVLLALELATVLGASFLYWVARWGGRPVVRRYGRYVGLTGARLERAESWVRGRGTRSVLVARLVPGLRIVTAVAAGVLDIPARAYYPGMVLGALIYIGVCAGAGYLLGPAVLAWLGNLRLAVPEMLGAFGSSGGG